jgi:hypothetical protein
VEAGVAEVEAHVLERVGEEAAPCGEHLRSRTPGGKGSAAASHHGRRRSVAEDEARDYVRHRRIVDLERERGDLDGDHERGRRRAGAQEVAGAADRRGSPGAAELGDRDAPHVSPHAHPVDQERVERRDREARA